MVFLNAATVRRIGSNRLATTFARSWARAGLSSLRFDTYGVGDSEGAGREEEPPANHLPSLFEPDRVTAVCEVLAWLARHRDARRFALTGLSAGGTTAFQTALADDRVRGIVPLNPTTLFWDEHAKSLAAWKDARRIARSPRSWRTLLRRGVRSWATDAARGAVLSLRGVSDDWQQSMILDSLAQLRARGTLVTIVFSSGDVGLTYLERHLGPEFRSVLANRGVAVEVIQGPDHTFRPLWSHDLLRKVFEDHLRRIEFFADALPLAPVSGRLEGAPDRRQPGA
jgi:hypothetical protein